MTPFHITNAGSIVPADEQWLDRDPRGIIWLWEPPQPQATYCMGVDPSGGITGWDRTTRTREDAKTDNGAIEIIRVGRDRDYQVAEFAAPLHPEDLADVANAMGRLYGGRDEEGQCLSIVECNNSGLLTVHSMINKHGYLNQFVWKYLDAMVPKATNSVGWYASSKSVPLLWARGARHILRGNLEIRSPALVEEMADAELDEEKAWARAIYGRHDDRLRAILLAIWAAHEWSIDVESEKTEIRTDTKLPEWQESDCSVEQMYREWNERWAE